MTYTEEEIEKVIDLALRIVQLDEIDYYAFQNGTNNLTHVQRKMNRKDLISIIRMLQRDLI